MILWSFPTLAVKFLTGYMDIYTQNVIRFTSASVFLWVMCLIRHPRELLSSAPMLLRVLPAVAATFCYQYLYCTALYVPGLMPGLTFLVVRSTVLFTALLSCIFFADERSTVRDRRFLIGITLSAIGVLGLLPVGTAPEGARAAQSAGEVSVALLLVIAAAFCWSCYTILIKLLVRRGSPLVTYTYVCTLMTIAFAALMATNSDTWMDVPTGWKGAWVWAVGIGSGMLCVGAAHVCYYYGIRTLGAAVCATVLLGNAFITPLLSAIWFDEQLGPIHIAAGAVLVIGSAITIQARPKKGRAELVKPLP